MLSTVEKPYHESADVAKQFKERKANAMQLMKGCKDQKDLTHLMIEVLQKLDKPALRRDRPPGWGLGRILANTDRDAPADYRERQGGHGGPSRTGGTNQGPAYYQECVSLFGKKVFMKPVNE